MAATEKTNEVTRRMGEEKADEVWLTEVMSVRSIRNTSNGYEQVLLCASLFPVLLYVLSFFKGFLYSVIRTNAQPTKAGSVV
jgi:hypothetical protein